MTGMRRPWATIASVLLLFQSANLAWANPVSFRPYESHPWLTIGSTRQSEVIQAIGQPGAVIDEARFRSEIVDRRSEYKAIGLTFWYVLDGVRDPKVDMVVVERPFQGKSSFDLGLGAERDRVLSRLSTLYKKGTMDGPALVDLEPLTAGFPQIALVFEGAVLTRVRFMSLLPPSEAAEKDRMRVVELIRRENLQAGFSEIPPCDFAFRVNRRLKTFEQERVGLADSNVNWRLELFENARSGTWTLVGFSRANVGSSKLCELARSDASGTSSVSYRSTPWYQKYFR